MKHPYPLHLQIENLGEIQEIWLLATGAYQYCVEGTYYHESIVDNVLKQRSEYDWSQYDDKTGVTL